MIRFFILCSFLVLFDSSYSQSLENIFEDHQLMGMSVVTICSGEILFAEHMGLRNYEDSLEVNDNTVYRIASISKMVTTIGLMKLYDQGLFELDDPIKDYIGWDIHNPNYPENDITFEMVLSHRGGIQDGTGYNDFLTASYNFTDTPPSIEELLSPGGDYYTSNMWRTEEPGTFFAYSNIHFGVIATLIEAISGERFDIYMKNEVFAPLGLNASYNVQDLEDINDVAVLYRNQSGWTPQADNYQGSYPTPLNLENYVIGSNGVIFAPQGGLRCSAIDLAELLLFLMEGGTNSEGTTLLTQESVNLMTTPQWTYDGGNGDNYYNLFNSWGLGTQCITNTTGGDIVFQNTDMFGHPGEAYGLISDAYFNFGGRGVIFLTNGAYNGYEFGTNSAFYTVEEEIFEYCDVLSIWCGFNVEETDLIKIKAFPNPTIDSIELQSPAFIDGGAHLMIQSEDGKTIKEIRPNISSKKLTLRVEELDSGYYFITVKQGQNTFTSSFIKQ